MLRFADSAHPITSATLQYQRLPNGELLCSIEVHAQMSDTRDGERVENTVHLEAYGLAFTGRTLADAIGQTLAFTAPPPEPKDVPNTNCYVYDHQRVVDNTFRVTGATADSLAIEWTGVLERAVWRDTPAFVLTAKLSASEEPFCPVERGSIAPWATSGPDENELDRLTTRFRHDRRHQPTAPTHRSPRDRTELSYLATSHVATYKKALALEGAFGADNAAAR